MNVILPIILFSALPIKESDSASQDRRESFSFGRFRAADIGDIIFFCGTVAGMNQRIAGKRNPGDVFNKRLINSTAFFWAQKTTSANLKSLHHPQFPCECL
jgi:hypothetical protein